MRTFSSNLWGQMPMPDNFIELISLILENKEGNGCNVSYWRGQADVSWKLDSSIVRKSLRQHPDIKDPDKVEKLISFGEEQMLNRAKKNLYHYEDHGRKISDIELLAKLQHFGAATRLLDFSKNVLNALWFCVSDKDQANRPGLLVGIHTNIIAGVGENYFDFAQDYSSFCHKLDNKSQIWMIDAPVVTQRISAQNSVFLCSKCEQSEHGYFLLPEKEMYLKSIAISPELKTEALSVLSAHFNITPYTVFPDIEGFASANSSKWRFSEFERW